MHVGEKPTFVFPRFVVTRHENGLLELPMLAFIALEGLSSLQVMLEKPPVEKPLAHMTAIAIPIGLSDQAFVHARKFLAPFIQATFLHGSTPRIDHPPIQRGCALIRARHIRGKHLGVTHDIENHTTT